MSPICVGLRTLNVGENKMNEWTKWTKLLLSIFVPRIWNCFWFFLAWKEKIFVLLFIFCSSKWIMKYKVSSFPQVLLGFWILWAIYEWKYVGCESIRNFRVSSNSRPINFASVALSHHRQLYCLYTFWFLILLTDSNCSSKVLQHLSNASPFDTWRILISFT